MKLFVFLLALVAATTYAEKAESEAERTMMWPEPEPLAAATDSVRACNPEVPHPRLYPYGTCNSDSRMHRTDDGSVRVFLQRAITLFGKSYSQLFVGNNGLVSFNRGIYTYTPRQFPISYNRYPIIAPYWADVDTRYPDAGAVFYRQVISGPTLAKAQRDVEDALPGIPNFAATIAVVVTWHEVGFYGSQWANNTNRRNTFQLVLVSDGPRTFSFFYYGQLQWTTGRSGGGDINGLGGVRAEVGFDAADRVNYYMVPFSFQSTVLGMTTYTNVNGPHTGRDGSWFSQYNLIGHLAPLMECLQRRTCCLMKGNMYRPTDNCRRFLQWDYLNHPAYPGHPSQSAAEGTLFDTFPTICTGNHEKNVYCFY